MSKDYEYKLASLCKRRIESFERNFEYMHDDMRQNRLIYRGKHEDLDEALKNYSYDFKLVYSIIKNLIPSLIISDPDIVLTPKKTDAIGKVKVVEKVLNYYWMELSVKKEIKKIVLDALIEGFGVIKLGWRIKVKYNSEKASSSYDYHEDGDIGGQKEFETNEYIKEDDLFIRRVSPLLMSWDPQAQSAEESRWFAEKIVKPLEEVKRSKLYDPKALDKLGGTCYGVQDVLKNPDGSVTEVDDSPDKYVVLYEVHDRERKKLITIAKDCEIPLRCIDYPYPMLEGSHFEFLTFHQDQDQVQGLSLVGLLKDQQNALNRVRAYQLDHVRRMATKYVVSDNSEMTDKDITKLTSAEPNTVSRISGEASDIKAFQPTPIPSDVYNVGELVKADMLQTSGTPPGSFGQAAGGRTSATEIKSIESAEQFRIEDMRSEVEDFSARLSRKMIQIAAAELDDKRTFLIAGEEDFVPINYTKEELKGEFDYRIIAGSMARPNRELERQQLLNLLSISQGNPQVDTTAIIKAIIKTYPNLRASDFVTDQPPAPPAPQGQGQGVAPQGVPDATALASNLTTNSGGSEGGI